VIDRRTEGWTDGRTDGIAVASTALAMRRIAARCKKRSQRDAILKMKNREMSV